MRDHARFPVSLLILGLALILACAPGGAAPDPASPSGDAAMERLRMQMVATTIEARGIDDPEVLRAMRTVPRHVFVPESLRARAYEDRPLPIGEKQTISQPYIVALMTALAEVSKGDKVLEVGTGSGYQAAVLAELGAEVHTIEIIPSLAARARRALESAGYAGIEYRVGDGYRGWPEASPFDAIIVTAAPGHVPQPLVEQLGSGGHLVIPVGEVYQELKVITRTTEGIQERTIIPVRFVPMTGEAQSKDDR